MGSLVSPVFANICMEKIEETAIETTPVPPKTWKRFVDDSFSIIKKNAVETFHNTLNSLDPTIQFTLEHEHNGKLAILDTVITRENGKLKMMSTGNQHIRTDTLTIIPTINTNAKSAQLGL